MFAAYPVTPELGNTQMYAPVLPMFGFETRM